MRAVKTKALGTVHPSRHDALSFATVTTVPSASSTPSAGALARKLEWNNLNAVV